MKTFFHNQYAPACIIVLQLIITLAVYHLLPDEMPMQFNAAGEVNWSLPKIFGAWTLPAFSGVIYSMGLLKGNQSLANRWFCTILMAVINIGFLIFIILR